MNRDPNKEHPPSYDSADVSYINVKLRLFTIKSGKLVCRFIWKGEAHVYEKHHITKQE